MDMRIRQLKNFLDNSHSVYHAVAGLIWELETAGYVPLAENECWELVPGGKYYVTRGGSSVIAFRIPRQEPTGFMMTASHADRPSFKLKENGELKGKYNRLSVEGYGGMIMGTWLDRPLSVAGRVMVQSDAGIESRLVDIDRDLLLIPNVAIHMNRSVNDGYKWNPAVDLLPLAGGEETVGQLQQLLEQEAGGPILGQDLYLYVRQKASIWGLEEEFISSAALDDLECAWCCTQGFLESQDSSAIPVLCVFDNEEVGSASTQGAGSRMLESSLSRICQSMGWDTEQLLAQSMMVSADNAHAVHPNHPELADSVGAPVVNRGIVLKFNANMRYGTDGVSAALMRQVCQLAKVPVQTYCNRADMPGGSTLGVVSVGHVSVPTADIGLAQLAMHSSYETAGVQDALYLMDAMTAYYSCVLETPGEGIYNIR